MKNSIVQLNKNTHSKLKIKNEIDFSLVMNRNLMPVILHEVSQLITEYPVVFIKNSETGQFVMASLHGLSEGSNLFFRNEEWIGSRAPASLTHYPLSLAANPDEPTQFAVTIDTDSSLVGEKEGEALFTESGDESEFLKKRIESLQTYHQCLHITQEFVNLIAELDLFEPQDLSYDLNGRKKSVSGIYLISEEKLNQLEDEKFLDLKRKGVLGPIYNHLASLSNISKLIKLSLTE